MIRLIQGIIKELSETFRFRYVVLNFVRSTLKLRYQRTVLGFIWSVLGPMMHYLVVGLVFSYTMRGAIPNYAAFMFAGALYYNVISGVTLRAPGILISNEHFIKKIYIPKLVFVLDTVFVELVNFTLGMVALLILGLIFNRVSFSYHFIFIPFAILLATFLTVGLGAIFAVAGVYFRDLAHIVPVVMQATFFLTPVIYKIDFMPPKVQMLIHLNPLYYFVEIFRDPIIYNIWPRLDFVVLCSLLAVGTLGVGLALLKTFENKIVFRL